MSPRLGWVLGLLVAAWLTAMPAVAQRATERFIPLGESPGLSQAKTLLGRIESADVERGVLTLETSGGRHEVAVGGATRIWLDRTGLGRSNIRGTLADCQPSRMVEVKLEQGSETAEWVKVRLAPAADPREAGPGTRSRLDR